MDNASLPKQKYYRIQNLPMLKRFLYFFGLFLSLGGIVFTIFKIHDHSSQLNLHNLDGSVWLLITGLSFTYGMANICLAIAWWNLLIHFGASTHRLWAVKTYGLTNLAKYIPGNLFHYASRQAMGIADGVGGWLLAKSSIWELGLMAVTATFFVLLALPWFFSEIPVSLITIAFTGFLIILTIELNRYMGFAIARAVGLYAIFLSVSGLIFSGLIAFLVSETVIELPQVIILCGAFVVAWLAGLATPGAPAGAGVREVVLMVLLKGSIPEAELLLAVILSRMVTVIGDVLFFLFATLITFKQKY